MLGYLIKNLKMTFLNLRHIIINNDDKFMQSLAQPASPALNSIRVVALRGIKYSRGFSLRRDVPCTE